MASQSLYRKWRSQTFDEVVGQKPIMDTLQNALKSGNLRHAYLFTGPRGTGKTTTARLLAKTVNCLHPRAGEPCNECEQCREITAGTSFNVIEIDAASNRGIDNIRELREKVMVPPATGKYKVYILDEAHMLTTEAFNALLKTLEEPPEYVIFVMATTDVHKMLPTVISRCQQFDFKRITTRQIVTHLLFVAQAEHIDLEQSAAELIARTAAGGMRDALSLLDQAIAYAGDTVVLSQVQAMLGIADPQAISKLVLYIADLDGPALLHQIHNLAEVGADLQQINKQVVEFWRALMLARAGADVATIMDLTEDEVKEIAQLAPRFALEELTECARIFAQNELMQKSQGTPQLGLELASLECIEVHRRVQSGPPAMSTAAASAPSRPAFGQSAAHSDVPSRQPSHLSQSSQTSQVSHSSQPSSVLDTASQPPTTVSQGRSERSPASSQAHRQDIRVPSSAEDKHVSSPAQAASPDNGAASQPALTAEQVAYAWENVRKRTKQKSNNAVLEAHLKYFRVLSVEGTAEQPVIVIQEETEKQVHYNYVKDGERYKIVEWALSIEFGVDCRLRLLAVGQSLPPGSVRDAASYSTGVLASQPSAHRERPTTPAPPAIPQISPVEPPPRVQNMMEPVILAPSSPQVLHEPHPSTGFDGLMNTALDDPLARMKQVRENSKGNKHIPEESLEQKVQRDPVVQEVIRTFSAKLVNVQPK